MLPPDAVRVAEYATPICPFGSEVVVMLNMAGVVVSVSAAVAFCTGLPESLTLKVSAAPDTAAVGVPLIAPVAVFNDSPPGNAPLASDHV